MVLPLAACGLAMLLGGGALGGARGLVAALAGCHAASLVIVFVLARYRLPMAALLMPFAAHAAVTLVAALRAREFGRAVAWLALTATTATLAALPVAGVDAEAGLGNHHALVARAHTERGDCPAALGAWRRTLDESWREAERLPLERWRATESAAKCMTETGDMDGARALLSALAREASEILRTGRVPYVSPERPGPSAVHRLTQTETAVTKRLRARTERRPSGG